MNRGWAEWVTYQAGVNVLNCLQYFWRCQWVESRDEPIRYQPIIGRPIIGRPIIGRLPMSTKNVFCHHTESYLFRLRLLSDDSYLPEGLQSADKTKCTQKQSYKTHPPLPDTEATLMFVYFWFSHFSESNELKLVISYCANNNRPIPTY